ncbi:MAG: hypothetical protein J6V72_06120 [Kiritimatiellae bacterium]|nr:hypothetical protein [Kiritimatiellia bacterium]
MKRILCSCVGVFVVGLLVAASSAMAEDLYFCPNADGKGGTNWKDSSSDHGWYIGKPNWTNAQGVVKTPSSSDVVWFYQAPTNTLNGRGVAKNVDNAAGSGTVGGIVYTNGMNNTVNQGTVTLAAGGLGVKIANNTTWYAVVDISGTGEVPFDIPSGKTLSVQKSLTGTTGTLVKRGLGTLVFASQDVSALTGRDFTAAGIRMEGGAFVIGGSSNGKFKKNTTAGFTLTFANNDPTEVLNLKYGDLMIENLTIVETEDVNNTGHGFTSSAGWNLAYLGGTSTVSPMSFTGSFKGSAGLVWAPANADTEIVLKKAAHPTTGGIWVSNGVVRVSEGASFLNLTNVTVHGSGARFAVDASAVRVFPATKFNISDGGKLRVGTGSYMSLVNVTTNGVMVADGVYRGSAGPSVAEEVDWIDGPGVVVVGAPVVGAPVAATWNGAGADTAATTLANWNGAEALPDLLTGETAVSVTGGATFTADTDVFAQGFTVGVTPFTLAPSAGKTLLIGSGGITGSGGTVTVGGAGTVVAAVEQTWVNGSGKIAVAGNVSGAGSAVTRIHHAGSGNSPTFAAGVTVGGDILFVDTSVAKNGTTSITIPENGSITFDGKVLSTNTASISIKTGAGSTVTFNDLFMSRNSGTMSGSGRIVFNGPMHFRDRPGLASGTVELHSTGNRLNGNMGTWNGGTLKAMVPYAINKTNTRRQTAYFENNSEDGNVNTHINLKDTCTIDLCGNDQSIDQLAMHADGTKSGGHVTSATPATFHLQTSKSYWAQHNYRYGFSDYSSISTADGYGYEAADKGYWEGAVNLSYEAANGMVRSMMRQSPSTGRVEVVSGRLVFLRRAATSGETFDLKGGSSNPYPRLANEDGGWTNATAVVVKGGTLELEHRNVFGPQTVVQFVKTSNAYGQIKLADGVRQRVFALEIDGVDQSRGTYGATGSGAQHVNDTLFAGGGVLSVVGDGMGMVILFR